MQDKLKPIIEQLVLFNNRTFTRKQWDIILRGCGCPKSTFLWIALRESNLQKYKNSYTMFDVNEEAIIDIFTRYRSYASQSMRKHALKKKARERVAKTPSHTFFMVGGVLTTEKPGED